MSPDNFDTSRCHYWLASGRQCSRRKGTEVCGDFCCQHARIVERRLRAGFPLWGQGGERTGQAAERLRVLRQIPQWYVGIFTSDDVSALRLT